MQYDVATPKQYLNALADDWRRDTLEQLRSLIKDAAPFLTEGIQYKMLSYSDSRGSLFHLNAQKHYVSLYVGNISAIDEQGELLAGLDLGKGCIRFKKSIPVADTQVEAFIAKAVSLHLQGKHTGC
ncbi:DUF1801 domain-containing protein [Thalassomonas viridans]|uniref:DUF1801 domain-containing protein n=1 Tax=Thalassomonas viridans TaxID=137584 RepID=A0AAE9Z2Z5_9GAMM|nr:DUF1801 domain-containing protein [Thalassomonas viridans]WDE05665.1 DUF1801 domain-containing protein [Thalassomonas viridans]